MSADRPPPHIDPSMTAPLHDLPPALAARVHAIEAENARLRAHVLRYAVTRKAVFDALVAMDWGGPAREMLDLTAPDS